MGESPHYLHRSGNKETIMLVNALQSSSYTPGATAAFGKNRDDQAASRAEAIRQGRGVQSDEQVESKVREVAEEFVSVFMNQVMKSMRATVQENPAMHGDNGEKFFQEMLDSEQSKALSKGSGYGLTDLIYESMMASYRVAQPQASGQAGDSMKGGSVAQPDALAVSGVA